MEPHDLRGLAEQLTLRNDGIWYSNGCEPVSYSEHGNEMCFELEEGSFWFLHRAACVRTCIQRFPPQGPIYDIGGGNGFVARDLIAAGFETRVVEPGGTGARNSVRRGVPTVICATLGSARFHAGRLPAAALLDVLEHIEDDRAFLRELHRCLMPAGRLYLTVPAGPWLWSCDDVSAGHFRRYTLSGLLSRLHQAGFAPLYITHLFALLPLPLFALRTLPSLFAHRTLALQGYPRLHQPRARAFTDRVWAAELRQVKRGRHIPFGSSCLVVAEKS